MQMLALEDYSDPIAAALAAHGECDTRKCISFVTKLHAVRIVVSAVSDADENICDRFKGSFGRS